MEETELVADLRVLFHLDECEHAPHEALENWEAYSRCRKAEFRHLDFAPGRGAKREDIEVLETVCDGCQVWRECLVSAGGLPGVWGGLSSNRRQKLRADGLVFDDLIDFDGPWELRVNRFGPGGA